MQRVWHRLAVIVVSLAVSIACGGPLALAGGEPTIPPHCQALMEWVAKFADARVTQIPLSTVVKALREPGLFPSETIIQMMEHIARYVYANPGSSTDALQARYGGACMGFSRGKEPGQ